MTQHYPRLRHRGIRPGRWKFHDGEPPRPRRELLARDVFRLAFYLPHDHGDIAEGVFHALDSYIRAVGEGPKTINYVYLDGNDEGAPLTHEWWGYIRNTFQPQRRWHFPDDYSEADARRVEKRGYETRLLLTGGINDTNGYQFEYRARIPYRPPSPSIVSLLSATLPTEYLEAHGAMRVRSLALEMASRLRFATGHAGLSLSFYSSLRSADKAFRAELARYPGIDLRTAWLYPHHMGVRVDGAHWLNFLGRPVLESWNPGWSLCTCRAKRCTPSHPATPRFASPRRRQGAGGDASSTDPVRSNSGPRARPVPRNLTRTNAPPRGGIAPGGRAPACVRSPPAPSGPRGPRV